LNFQIKARSACDDRQFPAGKNTGDRLFGKAQKVEDVDALGNVADPDQMVRDLRALRRCRLGCADLKPAVDLHRIE